MLLRCCCALLLPLGFRIASFPYILPLHLKRFKSRALLCCCRAAVLLWPNAPVLRC